MSRLILVVSLFTVWWIVTDPWLKLRSVAGATIFYFMESTYVWLHGKPFHSTFAQFWNNVWSHPLIADFYFLFIAETWGSFLRIACYPVVIWSLELLQDSVIRKVYGRNVAWDYSGNKFSLFKGAIDLSMAGEWWLLGIAMEYIYSPLAF